MKKRRQGFTLVEVSLFLALTGLLFVGVIAGMQNSVTQQRYNDSVRSFAEFLKTAYSKVANVQGLAGGFGGKSEKAIYGKLIVFGEEYRLNGDKNTGGYVYMYDVVGDIGSVGGAGALEALDGLKADVVVETKNLDGSSTWSLAGIAEEYIPRWGAAIQGKDPANGIMKGAILIVRHATSGGINTYVKTNETLEINNEEGTFSGAIMLESISGIYKGKWLTSSFNDSEAVDFCVNPEGDTENTENRRDVRIRAYARNASGVEVYEGEDNACR